MENRKCSKCNGWHGPAELKDDACQRQYRIIACPACRRLKRTDQPCASCAKRAQRPPMVKPCNGCGKDLGADAPGTRCPRCAEAHGAQSRVRYARQRNRILTPDVRAVLITRISEGERLTDLCAALGITQQRVWRAAERIPAFKRELDHALMVSRPADMRHGTQHGYRKGCRCPECREAKGEAVRRTPPSAGEPQGKKWMETALRMQFSR